MLFEQRAVIASPVHVVFDVVADIANAPNIHPMIIKRERLDDSDNLGIGSKFRYYYSFLGNEQHFDFEISEFIQNEKVVYMGTAFFGIVPKFTVNFRVMPSGTEVHYVMNPKIPAWMAYPVQRVMIPVGNRDLGVYFDKLKLLLEPQS